MPNKSNVQRSAKYFSILRAIFFSYISVRLSSSHYVRNPLIELYLIQFPYSPPLSAPTIIFLPYRFDEILIRQSKEYFSCIQVEHFVWCNRIGMCGGLGIFHPLECQRSNLFFMRHWCNVPKATASPTDTSVPNYVELHVMKTNSKVVYFQNLQ